MRDRAWLCDQAQAGLPCFTRTAVNDGSRQLSELCAHCLSPISLDLDSAGFEAWDPLLDPLPDSQADGQANGPCAHESEMVNLEEFQEDECLNFEWDFPDPAIALPGASAQDAQTISPSALLNHNRAPPETPPRSPTPPPPPPPPPTYPQVFHVTPPRPRPLPIHICLPTPHHPTPCSPAEGPCHAYRAITAAVARARASHQTQLERFRGARARIIDRALEGAQGDVRALFEALREGGGGGGRA
ncbi:MAG: hypothetical protein M1839_002914 [Geoglossum umbratile]|nr:MAG: hypothetical protein M1839_002914 [Geoglossum umbratile]